MSGMMMGRMRNMVRKRMRIIEIEIRNDDWRAKF